MYNAKQLSQFKSKILTGLSKKKSLKSIIDNDTSLPSRTIVYQWLNKDHKNYDELFKIAFYNIAGPGEYRQKIHCKSNPKGSKAVKHDDYRVLNARKVNKKRFPDSKIYIIRQRGTDIYKIGCSKNPNRRINDIQSATPYDIAVVKIINTTNAYEIEQKLHEQYKNNYIAREWFKLDQQEINTIIKNLSKWESTGNTPQTK